LTEGCHTLHHDVVLVRWLIAVILVLHASSVAAQIVPISQERFLTVHADLQVLLDFEVYSFTEDDEASASGFEPFDEEVSVTYATADQISRIGPFGISASGENDLAAEMIFEPGPPMYILQGGADTSTTFRVSFEIDEATPYELEASFTIYTGPLGLGSTWVSLTGPGDVLVFSLDTSPSRCALELWCSGSDATSGVLQAGTYLLEAGTSGWASTNGATLDNGYGFASYSVALTIPAEFVASVPALSPGSLALLALTLAASACRLAWSSGS
jgi:hypothetical protein